MPNIVFTIIFVPDILRQWVYHRLQFSTRVHASMLSHRQQRQWWFSIQHSVLWWRILTLGDRLGATCVLYFPCLWKVWKWSKMGVMEHTSQWNNHTGSTWWGCVYPRGLYYLFFGHHIKFCSFRKWFSCRDMLLIIPVITGSRLFQHWWSSHICYATWEVAKERPEHDLNPDLCNEGSR